MVSRYGQEDDDDDDVMILIVKYKGRSAEEKKQVAIQTTRYVSLKRILRLN